jgi:hypothetical protein
MAFTSASGSMIAQVNSRRLTAGVKKTVIMTDTPASGGGGGGGGCGGGGGGFQAAAAAAGEPLLASGEVVASVRFIFFNRRVSLGSPMLRGAGPRASELAAQWSEFHDLDLAWRLFVEEGEAAQCSCKEVLRICA